MRLIGIRLHRSAAIVPQKDSYWLRYHPPAFMIRLPVRRRSIMETAIGIVPRSASSLAGPCSRR
jgi:hypothetical protein